jgi:hypothetical protein
MELRFGNFSANELAECARRELIQRRRVYTRLVDDGKVSQSEADREIGLMRAIAEHFEGFKNPRLL